MLGWIVLLMRMNEILFLFVSIDAWYKSLVLGWLGVLCVLSSVCED
jgi:hypothetical protein